MCQFGTKTLYQRVSLQITHPVRFFGKKKGGYLVENFLVRFFYVKKFPALRAGKKKGWKKIEKQKWSIVWLEERISDDNDSCMCWKYIFKIGLSYMRVNQQRKFPIVLQVIIRDSSFEEIRKPFVIYKNSSACSWVKISTRKNRLFLW